MSKERMSAGFNGTVNDLWNYVMRYFEIAEPDFVFPSLWPQESHDSVKLDLMRNRKLTKKEIKKERRDSGISPHIEMSGAVGEPERIGSIEMVRVTDTRAELICWTETNDARQWCSGLIEKMEREEFAVDSVKLPGRSRLRRKNTIERIAYAMLAEEIKKAHPDAKWKEIRREIGWSFGKTPGSRKTSLTTTRQKLAGLEDYDPERILEEAKVRCDELKREKKIME